MSRFVHRRGALPAALAVFILAGCTHPTLLPPAQIQVHVSSAATIDVETEPVKVTPAPLYGADWRDVATREALDLGLPAPEFVSDDGCNPDVGEGLLATACISFMGGEPTLRIIDSYAEKFPQNDVKMTVRHEASHRDIWQKCGTPTPPVAADRTESVTDAWADINYDYDVTHNAYEDPTAADYDTARAIARGECTNLGTVDEPVTGPGAAVLRTELRFDRDGQTVTINAGERVQVISVQGSEAVIQVADGEASIPLDTIKKATP